MPYFMWRGVNLSGADCKGKMFARNIDRLDEELFKRNIALLSYKQLSTLWLSHAYSSHILIFFERLAVLMNAGILLPDALALLADTMHPVRLQLIIEKMYADIQNGFSLSQALTEHAVLFDNMVVQLVHVGQEAGALPKALLALNAYGSAHQIFMRKMRSALMMPFISLLFFGALAFFIIVFLLPTVTDVLTGLRHEIPPLTQIFLSVAAFMRSWHMLATVSIACFLIVGLWYYLKNAGRCYWDAIVLKIPYINKIVIHRDIGWFMSSVALLLRYGVAMVPALAIARCIIQNQIINELTEKVEQNVAAGDSLSTALQKVSQTYATQDIIAMVHVGEESGTISNMLEEAAEVYHGRITSVFNVLSTVIQPLILVVLGLMIALLILAIYTPLFNMIDALG